jgi:hypothetical protein
VSTLYLLTRFTKALAVAALFTGTIGAFLPRDLVERRRFATFFAGPGFVVSWGAGFLLAYLSSTSLFSGWLLGSMALSLFSLQVVLYTVGKDGRRGPITAFLATASLTATLALMVWRP